MYKILLQIARAGIRTERAPSADEALRAQAPLLSDETLKLLGRALAIRHADAGSCNGCELEIHAANNPYINLEGLGIKFVASPRHADLDRNRSGAVRGHAPGGMARFHPGRVSRGDNGDAIRNRF